MEVVWAVEEPPERWEKALFLAGPTPRDPAVRSWREDALEQLKTKGYDGVVFVPEPRGGRWRQDYTDQVQWEERCLNLSDAVVFWVPRDMERLPGMTTNIEWGVWQDSGRVVLGAPPDAPKMRYLRHYAEVWHVPQATTLSATLDAALGLIGAGVMREGGARAVPLVLWRTRAFQAWYGALIEAGHRLDDARVEWVCRAGRGRRWLFAWALRPRVWVAGESRHKGSEVVLLRPDVSAVVAWWRGATLEASEVVLVREYRAAQANASGQVWELPGGSAPDPEVADDALQVAAEEMEEETGVQIAPARLAPVGARQLAATMLGHRASVYAVELTDAERATFRARHGQQFGAHGSERTYVHVASVGELLGHDRVDWSNLGMILGVIAPCFEREAAT